MSLSKDDVVYHLKNDKTGITLRLVSRQTRKYLKHTRIEEIDFLPDVFYPVSAEGALVATWSTRTTALRATRAMKEAGIFSLEDIDHIEEIVARERKEEEDELREQELAEKIRRMFAAVNGTESEPQNGAAQTPQQDGPIQ